ncbi:hypothetical protein CGK04_08475 [Vibrio parahaemolyticus]|nr:hypothetical protein AL469_009245 [Vibrio harveyi]TOB52391.1 hypothetical protein CGK04_08475 [Vibrio parahaemolyticus]TOH66623.1 hypothetical protein CGI76_21250 [Vibrio parahaemolyticus]TOI66820.1 hypothetical protein CGI55_05130 [Vibrio parahaemolyticus]HAS6392484.1 winged helix-turn-helix transcriptional regulator [Vibrio vulnificus]
MEFARFNEQFPFVLPVIETQCQRREILRELYRKQLEDNGRVNLSQIAREMGLSRQRVSVLVKELLFM